MFVEGLDPAQLPSLGHDDAIAMSALSEEERMLVLSFRSLNPAFQQLILNDMDRYAEAERQTVVKKGESSKRRA
ncbi:hypothetical protein A9973_25540 [Achromobacter sp. UMC46]|nr:hypothetical protein [Achromobacter sp. UMC46]